MTGNQIKSLHPEKSADESRLKDLEEENELLLLQLHQVQEELESYFLKCQALEKKDGGDFRAGTSTSIGGVDDELPEALAEAARLAALVEAQTRLQRIESTNALNARLGDILIQSVSSSGSLAGLPTKLLAIWRASKAEHPPAVLGGKNFEKVISAYREGGFEAVSQLLSAVTFPEMRAKAYTALARQQMKEGLFVEAAESARRAYEEDPRPYRLKWLAFRLHEAGEIIEADATLSLLPQDTPFSDSESRQREQVRYEAKSARLREAKQKIGFESGHNAIERQIETIQRSRDQQTELATERQSEIEDLRRRQEHLEQEKSDLFGRYEALAISAAESESRIKRLLQSQEEMAADHERQIEELKTVRVRLEQEKSDLSALYDEQAKLAAKREQQIEQQRQAQAALEAKRDRELGELKSAMAKLEQEKSDLSGRNEALAISVAESESRIKQLLQSQKEMAADHERQIEELKIVRVRLEQEKSDLSVLHDEQAKLAAKREQQIEQQRQAQAALEAERGRELGELKSAMAKLEQEKSDLSGRYEALAISAAESESRIKRLLQSQEEMAADHERQIEELKTVRVQLEQEKSDLSVLHDEQAKLAAKREQQIEQQRQAQAALETEQSRELGELKSAMAKLEQEKSDLSGRHEALAISAAESESRIKRLLQSQEEMAADHERQIEELKTVRVRLEQEKGGLVVRCDEQAKLAAERLKQMNELQPQLQKRLETETELSMRQQLMQEELIRAEAQLDLIKDIILKEPGL